MYRYFQRRLAERVRAFLRTEYGIELPNVIVQQPPAVSLGEYALPLSFELAKRLHKSPRKIAEEIVGGLGEVEGFERVDVAGAGYVNARLQRGGFAAWLAADRELDSAEQERQLFSHHKVLVEHSSINPNKAAHIGHLRNAILGDTFVRLLRSAGRTVDVQNYIDNTGVQVADVVVGFRDLEGKSLADIQRLAEQPRFDYLCWDVYAGASRWYEENEKNLEKRSQALHAIESGGNEIAALAELISSSVLRRHLETMERIDIEYDFLPRESEILSLHFWDLAFRQLKDKDVIYLETKGKKAGCWVMKRPGASRTGEDEDDTKVIVRSNGTVVYEGKDIAYHMWKFGLLGRDFGYRRFFRYPNGHECWISTLPEKAESDHPHFGGVKEIYNVIDARQSEAQNAVIEALRALGYSEAAENYTHFSYEMVALTPRCAAELGYQLSEDEWGRSFIEVSGRKGFGVKADDFIDRLLASAKAEVDSRHSELSDLERRRIAEQIALGALRYFMLKFTKQTVIAFDFKEALSFEGDTGPYAQYAVVRATNVFRRGGITPEAALAAQVDYEQHLSGDQGNEFWELWLTASKTSFVVDQCIATREPSFAARHVFQLAQLFNNFYHRHRILAEPDSDKRKFLLATAAVVRREMIRVLDTMGISVPPVM